LNAEENAKVGKVKLFEDIALCTQRLASLEELNCANIDLAHELVSMTAKCMLL
jgi:hypothetical protein